MTAAEDEFWGDVVALYELAGKAADAFLAGAGVIGGAERQDVIQEGVTWLLERPGRAWVRAVDGTMEDPEETTVKDIVEHLQRVQWGG